MRRALKAKSPWTGEPRTALSTGRGRADTALPLSSSPGDGQRVARGWAGRWDCIPLRDAPYHIPRRVALPLPSLARLGRTSPGGGNLSASQQRRPAVILPIGMRRLDGNARRRQPVLRVCCCRYYTSHPPACHLLHRRKQRARGAGDVLSRGRGHHARGGQSEKCALSWPGRDQRRSTFFSIRGGLWMGIVKA
jgi:hypothetical protein